MAGVAWSPMSLYTTAARPPPPEPEYPWSNQRNARTTLPSPPPIKAPRLQSSYTADFRDFSRWKASRAGSPLSVTAGSANKDYGSPRGITPRQYEPAAIASGAAASPRDRDIAPASPRNAGSARVLRYQYDAPSPSQVAEAAERRWEASSRGGSPPEDRQSDYGGPSYSRRGDSPPPPTSVMTDGYVADDGVRAHDARLVEDPTQGESPLVKKKYIRQMEVPFVHDVKVPVRHTKVVDSVEKRRVPVKKLVEVPSYRVENEEYTEVEQRTVTRDKEVWVKQIVPETVVENVEVTKTRPVQVPTVEVREVETFEEVDVPVSRKVEVDAYRIDRVEDRRVVEVDEYETYRMQAVPTGEVVQGEWRDVGILKEPHRARHIGEIVEANDPRLRDIESDRASDLPRSGARHTTLNVRSPVVAERLSAAARGSPRSPRGLSASALRDHDSVHSGRSRSRRDDASSVRSGSRHGY